MRTHIHRHSPTSASSLPRKPGRTATHQQNMGDWETLNSTYLVCVSIDTDCYKNTDNNF